MGENNIQGTSFAEVYEYALTEIDSYKLKILSRQNPALFYRKMFLYLQQGVPYFDSPIGIQEKLQYTKPTFNDGLFTVTANSAEISTGIKGFETVCAVVNDEITPLSYDNQTGIITLEKTFGHDVTADIDFYTDGYFHTQLNGREMQILGLCIGFTWFKKFANDELDMKPKMKDSSFKIGSEFGDTNSRTSRMESLYNILQLQLGSYARDVGMTPIIFGTQK